MASFTQKLTLIYDRLFDRNIDKFTEAFIDYNKFNKDKFNHDTLQQNRQQFFLNRKTVLRRWLLNGITCTPDFQKSFKNYKISHYKYRGDNLFNLDNFQHNDNIQQFENRIDNYLRYQKQANINTQYQYIYAFNEQIKKIELYEIKEWIKGENNKTIITFDHNNEIHKGTFSLEENHNIFITLQINTITLYLLFHDNNDCSSDYIVGTGMGYLVQDNKVPRAEKVILSKKKLNSDDIELQFILNETESITAIENRLNLNTKEVKINHFVKFSNTLKRFNQLFFRLVENKFSYYFYYRLAFREFYALFKLFERVSQKQSYFIINHKRAFLELLKTVEAIQNIQLYTVMELHENSIFLQNTPKDIEIQNRFMNLSLYQIENHITFVVEDITHLCASTKNIINKLIKKEINVKVVNKSKVIHEVNSLDFTFIYTKSDKDFVLADPIRDNKDVYKLFINPLTMEEYRTDYKIITDASVDAKL